MRSNKRCGPATDTAQPISPNWSTTTRKGQYTSIRFGHTLEGVGIADSVGSTGDSYDNALAETINGLYKNEVIKPRKPWKTTCEVEIATAEWANWFNHRRLYEFCGDIPPAELEAAHYARTAAPQLVASPV